MRRFNKDNLILRNFEKIKDDVPLLPEMIEGSIKHCYETLDLIDQNLIAKQVAPLAELVERANLSSIVGNLLGAGFAEYSNGVYFRNKPHTYPDLISTKNNIPGIEIKTALSRNSPKGHLPKAGYYLTYRYLFTDTDGNINNLDKSMDTVSIWEVKFGFLNQECFSCSNTTGDSGKTAVIRTEALNKMLLLYFDPDLVPYKHTINHPYKGFN